MGMRALLLTSLTAILLGCSPPASQAPDQNADNAAPPASMNQMQPGQYRTTMTILDMNMPGVPAGAMANMHPAPIVTEHCVTATDITDYTAPDLTQGPGGMTCTAVRSNSSGGRIDNEATCTGPTGTMTMHMVGAYTPTRVEMEMTSTTQMPNNAGVMTQRMQMVNERIGECPAGSAAAP